MKGLLAGVEEIASALATAGPRSTSRLVAVSGIDGAGKGFTTSLLARALGRRGVRTAVLHADDWLSPPRERFGEPPSAEGFYERAFEFDALFSSLVTPLVTHRKVELTVALGGQSGIARPCHYRFDEIDCVVLEGIFLLKRELRSRYDETIWVDCSFESALARALERNQEGLSPAAIVRDYEGIYFPAQRIHASRDAPRRHASFIVLNDGRRGPVPGAR